MGTPGQGSSGLIDRRQFLKAAGAVFLAGLAPRAAEALVRTDAVYASAFRDRNGDFGLAILSEAGEVVTTAELPGRAHGLAASPVTGQVVAFARRPGTFALALDLKGKTEPVVFSAPENRHFYGHGHFSPDGRLLYASENDFDGNRGVIGLYDALDGFRRLGEFSAHGIGTHDMSVSDDGSLLIIANGGIETHPDFGRTKLNLDHMQPSLVLADAKTGALLEKHDMPANLRQLSTRHVDLDAKGRIWFACQYEGPRTDLPPLVGHFSRGEAVRFIDLPPAVTEGLANYVGAIAVNRMDGLVGVTSPNGGMAVTIEAASGRVLSHHPVADAAGIAAAAHGFAVSSYRGDFAGKKQDVNWDQHIIRLR
ncbi:DUF1513 domain-containing protein [Rhizobium paknamense]|uniref:DUF1513 domain-containing protein n=1 Tax=Rhizobium paknamense TaxID=1206817 RepID=A0ABU0IDM3_9HYPH|nr:DUF1513 domain-containing protein [Rhizobium paknamense]MDQ0455346.1 hypothetical protein [Rhizobium paknamense]